MNNSLQSTSSDWEVTGGRRLEGRSRSPSPEGSKIVNGDMKRSRRLEIDEINRRISYSSSELEEPIIKLHRMICNSSNSSYSNEFIPNSSSCSEEEKPIKKIPIQTKTSKHPLNTKGPEKIVFSNESIERKPVKIISKDIVKKVPLRKIYHEEYGSDGLPIKKPAKKGSDNPPIKKSTKKNVKDEPIKKSKKKDKDKLEQFIKKLELHNPEHNKIKHLLKSLKFDNLKDDYQNDNIIIQQLKNIIKNYVLINYLEITQKCNLILADIYNDNTTDFIIKFSDDDLYDIKCHKVILKTIPYFSMIFDDITTDNTINLQNNKSLPNYDITNRIIKLLYYPNDYNDVVTVINFIQIFEQMNMWLMKDHFHIMVKYAQENIKKIVTLQFEVQNFDNILILYNILNSIATEKFIKNNEFSFGENEKLKRNAKIIIDKIVKLNLWNEHIFMFDDWQNLFSDEQKLNAIYILKNYELLNVSKLKPKSVIRFLANLDYKNDAYCDFHNCNDYDYEAVNIFNPNILTFCPNHDEEDNPVYSIITSYYPIFNYSIFTLLDIKITRDSDIKSAFSFKMQNEDTKIFTGSRIFITESDNSTKHLMSNDKKTDTHLSKWYTVQKITKCITFNNKMSIIKADEYEVTTTKYVPNSFNPVTYKIFLDKDLPSEILAIDGCSCDTSNDCECDIKCIVINKLSLYTITNFSCANDCKTWPHNS